MSFGLLTNKEYGGGVNNRNIISSIMYLRALEFVLIRIKDFVLKSHMRVFLGKTKGRTQGIKKNVKINRTEEHL